MEIYNLEDLRKRIKKIIYDYFDIIIEQGFLYKEIYFQANEESTNRVVKAIKLFEDTGILSDWNATDNSVYYFEDAADLNQFSIEMAIFWAKNFKKRTTLRNELINLNEQELLNYDIITRWNNAN